MRQRCSQKTESMLTLAMELGFALSRAALPGKEGDRERGGQEFPSFRDKALKKLASEKQVKGKEKQNLGSGGGFARAPLAPVAVSQIPTFSVRGAGLS